MASSQFQIDISDDAIYFGGRIIGYVAQRAPFSEKERFKDYVENLPPVDETGMADEYGNKVHIEQKAED